MHEFVNYVVQLVGNMWYIWIFIMMVLESSLIPFPSEIAMIPAWYLSCTWELNFYISLFVWTFWAIIWATINYIIAFKLWEKLTLSFIRKFWKYFLINEKHYRKAENYFLKHWNITIFSARFIPGIRQIISLPAWSFEMNYRKFFFYTMIWAWIWNFILMVIGYIAWKNKDLIKQYTNSALFYSIIFLIIIISIYIYYNNKKRIKD